MLLTQTSACSLYFMVYKQHYLLFTEQKAKMHCIANMLPLLCQSYEIFITNIRPINNCDCPLAVHWGPAIGGLICWSKHGWYNISRLTQCQNLPILPLEPQLKNSRGVFRAADSISRHFRRTGSLVAAATGTVYDDMSPPPAWSSDRDCPSAPENDVSPAETIELSPVPESSNSLVLRVESTLSRRDDASLELRLTRAAWRCSLLSSVVSK